MHIDLNCDLGESFGNYQLGLDEAVMKYITSANVACGFHASDPRVLRYTVALCREQGVALGAHPGYPDLVGFGRREMAVSPDEVRDDVLYQLGAIEAFCRAEGAELRHVKPHGAMYNQACKDIALARGIAAAIKSFNPSLRLFALPGTELARAGEAAGLPVAYEAFADRAVNEDGTLVNRKLAGAMIHDQDVAVGRVLRLVMEGKIQAITGKDISLKIHTLCVHGDNPSAVGFVKTIRERLEAAGVVVSRPD